MSNDRFLFSLFRDVTIDGVPATEAVAPYPELAHLAHKYESVLNDLVVISDRSSYLRAVEGVLSQFLTDAENAGFMDYIQDPEAWYETRDDVRSQLSEATAPKASTAPETNTETEPSEPLNPVFATPRRGRTVNHVDAALHAQDILCTAHTWAAGGEGADDVDLRLVIEAVQRYVPKPVARISTLIDAFRDPDTGELHLDAATATALFNHAQAIEKSR